MAIILHIDASARISRSVSRELSAKFMAAWKSHNPDDTVIRRDVGLNPPPAMSEAWIAAAFTPAEQRTNDQRRTLALSEVLFAELEPADIIVLGTPMYNYGMPAALKAWVDQVIRVNQSFTFDLERGDLPIEQILSGKTLVLLTSCGEFGFEPGGERSRMNHLDTHFQAMKHYFGVDRMHHIAIEYQEFGDKRHANSIAAAHAAIPALVKRLSVPQAEYVTAS